MSEFEFVVDIFVKGLSYVGDISWETVIVQGAEPQHCQPPQRSTINRWTCW